MLQGDFIRYFDNEVAASENCLRMTCSFATIGNAVSDVQFEYVRIFINDDP